MAVNHARGDSEIIYGTALRPGSMGHVARTGDCEHLSMTAPCHCPRLRGVSPRLQRFRPPHRRAGLTWPQSGYVSNVRRQRRHQRTHPPARRAVPLGPRLALPRGRTGVRPRPRRSRAGVRGRRRRLTVRGCGRRVCSVLRWPLHDGGETGFRGLKADLNLLLRTISLAMYEAPPMIMMLLRRPGIEFAIPSRVPRSSPNP